ncbi:9956_t:CDS:2, partial [Acaulospora morrowiae]
ALSNFGQTGESRECVFHYFEVVNGHSGMSYIFVNQGWIRRTCILEFREKKKRIHRFIHHCSQAEVTSIGYMLPALRRSDVYPFDKNIDQSFQGQIVVRCARRVKRKIERKDLLSVLVHEGHNRKGLERVLLRRTTITMPERRYGQTHPPHDTSSCPACASKEKNDMIRESDMVIYFYLFRLNSSNLASSRGSKDHGIYGNLRSGHPSELMDSNIRAQTRRHISSTSFTEVFLHLFSHNGLSRPQLTV